jgi:propionyl-CoA carboxylase alpha chain
MIRIAAGDKLSLKQADITPKGWAVEVRLYAEDPSRGFLPAIGKLTRYREPQGEGVRVDSGVHEGGEISIYYDPMIAKLIGYGKTREVALQNLADGLDDYVIEGLSHNRQFLRHMTDHTAFRKGDFTTGFIADEYPEGYTPGAPDEDVLLTQMRGLAVLMVAEYGDRMAMLGGPQALAKADQRFVTRDEAGETTAIWDRQKKQVEIDGQPLIFDGNPDRHGRLFRGMINDQPVIMQCRHHAARVEVMAGAYRIEVHVLPERMRPYLALMPEQDIGGGAAEICAPMPGLLTKMLISVGDQINPGDDIAVIEAMKMENLLKSDVSGMVGEILANAGETVAADQPLVRLTPPDDADS